MKIIIIIDHLKLLSDFAFKYNPKNNKSGQIFLKKNPIGTSGWLLI
jgi:hypothetical protein